MLAGGAVIAVRIHASGAPSSKTTASSPLTSHRLRSTGSAGSCGAAAGRSRPSSRLSRPGRRHCSHGSTSRPRSPRRGPCRTGPISLRRRHPHPSRRRSTHPRRRRTCPFRPPPILAPSRRSCCRRSSNPSPLSLLPRRRRQTGCLRSPRQAPRRPAFRRPLWRRIRSLPTQRNRLMPQAPAPRRASPVGRSRRARSRPPRRPSRLAIPD